MRKTFPITFSFIVSALFAASLLLMISCQDEEMTKSSIHDEENQSEISLIEKATGVTFYKQDLTVTDATGENRVVLRVAALEEALLNEYLELREITIKPLFDKPENVRKIGTKPADDQIQQPNELNNEMGVIVEILSQELQPGVVGFAVYSKYNEGSKPLSPSNGKTLYLRSDSWTSPNWPERLALQAYSQITFRIMYKDRWWKGWYTALSWETWYNGQYELFGIDDPYRVRLDVQYDYRDDFYFEWFNW